MTSVAIAVASLFLYLLLGQETFYGVDGWRMLRRLSADDIQSDVHLLYKPMASALHRFASAQFGWTLYESVRNLGAIGTAIGVGFCHAAARRLGFGWRRALAVTAIVALAPGVMFFATVVERHGPFFAFAGLAAYASAWLAVRPGAATGVAFGLSCALAYAAHSTGVLLLGCYVPFALAWARARSGVSTVRPLLVGAVAAGAATVGGLVVARLIAGPGGAGNLEFLSQHAAENLRHPERLPICAWQEIVLPFAPVSLLWVAAYRGRSTRLVAWSVAVGIGVYLAFTFAILGDFDERGAYALPLVWPLAALVVVRLGWRWGVLAAIAAAYFAVAQVLWHDDGIAGPASRFEPRLQLPAVARDLRDLVGGARPYLIVAEPADFELLFLHFPELRPTFLPQGITGDYFDGLDGAALDPEAVRPNASLLADFLAQVDRSGRPVMLPDTAADYLLDPYLTEQTASGPIILKALEDGLRWERIDRGAFHGWRLLAKE